MWHSNLVTAMTATKCRHVDLNKSNSFWVFLDLSRKKDGQITDLMFCHFYWFLLTFVVFSLCELWLLIWVRSPLEGTSGEGNGNPLQYSCLENPRDRGAWWAAVCGVAQSRTRLKRLSSRRGQSTLFVPISLQGLPNICLPNFFFFFSSLCEFPSFSLTYQTTPNILFCL